MSYTTQIIQPLPVQDELREVGCGVEKLEQVVSRAKARQQEEEPLLDEIENIHRL